MGWQLGAAFVLAGILITRRLRLSRQSLQEKMENTAVESSH
jgi:hypothetical protein